MIDINKPINAVVSSLTDSKRFNEFEASRIAVDANAAIQIGNDLN